MRAQSWLLLSLLPVGVLACGCPHRSGSNGLISQDATPVAHALDFGNVPIGVPKNLPLTLANAGTIELDVSTVTISGPNAKDFAVISPFKTAVQPNNSTQATIQFSPSASGPRSATLEIASNSTGVPVLAVALTGDGIDVVIATQPTALDFGPVQVGTAKTLKVTFTNKGTSSSDPLSFLPVTGNQASEFAWVGQGTALPPNGSLTLQVTFSPTIMSNASAAIPYTYCTGCGSKPLPLLGEGIDGQLVFVPTPLSFGTVPVGSPDSLPVTITNVGTAEVAIQALSILGGSRSPFSVGGLPTGFPGTPILLAPNGSQAIKVDYTPATAAGDQDTLVATFLPGSLGSGGAFQASAVLPRTAKDLLYGNEKINPCTLSFKPPSINFGAATPGTSTQKSVTVSNLGQASCTVSQIAMAANSDAAFTLVNPATTSLTIPVGGSATIAVACDVASSSPPLLHTGAIAFQSTDPAMPTGRVPLTTYVKGKSPYPPGWPKWHMGNTDEGQSEADTSGNNGTLLWRFNVTVPPAGGGLSVTNSDATYLNSPVVGPDGTVYQLGMDGNLYAVNPDGSEKWKVMLISPASDPHPATPIIAADGTLYVEAGCDSPGVGGQIFHVSATGSILHAEPAPPAPTNCRRDPNGKCYASDGFDVCPSLGNTSPLLFDGDDFGYVVTYQTQTGGSFSIANEIVLDFYGERVGLAIAPDDTSYWCSLNRCFAVSPPSQGFAPLPAWTANGVVISRDAPGLNSGAGTTAWTNSDLAFDGHHTGWIMAMVAWESGGGGPFGGGGATTAQTELVALDPKDGSNHWTFKMPQFTPPMPFDATNQSFVFTPDIGNSAPAVADDGTVYVGNGDGLHAVEGQTGTEKAGFPFLTADVTSAPAIGGDGTVFFGTSDGAFYAVNPDGTKRYKYVTQARVSSSPAIGPDGTVFFVSDDGNLYALR